MNSRACKTLLYLSIGLLCGCATTKAQPQNAAHAKSPSLKLSWITYNTKPPQTVEIRIKQPNGFIKKQQWTTFEDEPYEWDGFNYQARSIFSSGWFKTPGNYTITVCSPKCSIKKSLHLTGKEIKVVAELRKEEGKWSAHKWAKHLPPFKGVSLTLLPKKQWRSPIHPVFLLQNNSAQTVCSLGVDGFSGHFETQTTNGWRVANTKEIQGESANYMVLKTGNHAMIAEHYITINNTTDLSQSGLRFVKGYRTGNCPDSPEEDAVWELYIVSVPFKPLSSSLFRRSNTTTR